MGATARRRRIILAAVVTAGLLGGAGAGPAAALSGEEWVADARASSVDFGIVTTGGFIVDRIDPSGALAVSHLETATEVATSLASAPYPSEIGEQGPGLLYGAAQNTLPYNGIPVPALGQAPSWPFTVRSSANGADPKSATAGGDSGPFGLRTESKGRVASGEARSGGSAPGFALLHMTAASRTDATQPGKATAKAISTVEGLTIGDVLRIGQVRTEVELSRLAGAAPEVSVRRSVDGLSVAGVAAVLRPEGLFVKDTGAPMPAPVLEALHSAGIELRIGEQRETSGAVKASGVVVRRHFDFGGTTMATETALGVVSGNVTQVGGDDPVGTGSPTADTAPATGVAPAPTARSEAPAAGPAATAQTVAPQQVVAPVTSAGPAEASPVMRLAADTMPATGAAAKKSMGWTGLALQVGAILAVVVLVAARARRVVGER